MFEPYLRGLRGKCPNCGRGQLAKGLWGTHERCAHCGLVYQNAPGDFTGAVVLSYSLVTFISISYALLMIFIAKASLPLIMISGFTLITLVSVATYQPLKGVWIAFLVQNGWLTPPPR